MADASPSFGAWLRAKLLERRMSLAQLCRTAGCDYTYVWRIVHADTAGGRRYLRPSFALTQRLGAALDAPREALSAAGYESPAILEQAQVTDRLATLQRELNDLRTTVARPTIEEWPLRGLPVLGRIPAGPLREALEVPEGEVALPEPLVGEAVFALRVTGESMVPTLHDGDLVAVRPQATAAPGELVVAHIDGEGTVKRFEVLDGVPTLVADNPSFPALRLDGGELLGVITAAYRPADELRRRPGRAG